MIARVDGTDAYRVELRARKSKLDAECTCPHAADGYFCKHCVAVGLAWIASHTSENSSGASTGKVRGRAAKTSRRDPWRDIQTYLQAQTPAALPTLASWNTWPRPAAP